MENLQLDPTARNGNSVSQTHFGSGDNVAGNKTEIINNYTGKSSDYKSLVEQIERQKRYLIRIPESETEERLAESAKLNELVEQEKQFREDVFKLYETFTRIEINTERLVLAQAHFEAGEFVAARVGLNAEQMGAEQDVLLERQTRQQTDLSHTKAQLTKNANEFLILARLTAIDYELADRFDQTKSYFEQSLRAERNKDNVSAYAYFLHTHNQFVDSQPLYEESLLIYRDLAKSDSQTYLPFIANRLNNLGVVLKHRNEYTKAEARLPRSARNTTEISFGQFSRILI